VATNVLRALRRQWRLVLAGALVGVALGFVILPQLVASRATYTATVRMEVAKSPAESIFQIPPAFGVPGDEDRVSTDVLKDIAVAERVAEGLPSHGDDRLIDTDLLKRLKFAPVSGTSLVDVSFVDKDPKLASSVVQQYAADFARRRNTTEARRLERAIMNLEQYAQTLQGRARVAAFQQLNEVRIKQATIGPSTVVVSERPIVTSSGPPLYRPVTVCIGLLLGLALGAGAALLSETAFPKVTTPSDAEEASQLPFIAAVRKSGISRTPLPVVERPFSPAAEDYRRVSSVLERQGLGSDIRVLAVVSADPGDGKTLLAANLAHSLARQGREVVLVSSDLRRPQMEKLLGLGPNRGLAEALQDDPDPIPAIGYLVSINDHLMALPAGSPSKHPSELLASRRLTEAIQQLREVGTVILDTPAARMSADAIALSAVADATVFVARSGATRMRSVREAAMGLRRDRIRPLGVVLVGTSSRPPFLRFSRYEEPPEFEEQEQLFVPPPPVPLDRRPSPASPTGNGSGRPSTEGGLSEPKRSRKAAE
jgi:Mrp family chromosome partitioning ATPase